MNSIFSSKLFGFAVRNIEASCNRMPCSRMLLKDRGSNATIMHRKLNERGMSRSNFTSKRNLSTESNPNPNNTSSSNTSSGKGENFSRYAQESANSSKERGPVTFASLALAAVAGLALVTYFKYEKDQKIQNNSQNKVTSYGKASVGGPWCLVDSNGNIKSDLDYRGKFLLLYFGFTYCPDICPTELVKIGKIMKELESRKLPVEVKPLFISVDPVRDTVGQLRNYMQDFHPSMEFLTGTPEQVYGACRAFRVYFNKTDDEDEDEEYLVDHSIVVYFMDPEGEFLDFYTQKMDAKDIADKIIAKTTSWKPNQGGGIQVSEQRK